MEMEKKSCPRYKGQQLAVKSGSVSGRTPFGFVRKEDKTIIPDLNDAMRILALYVTFLKGAKSPEITERFTIEELGQIFHKSPTFIARLLSNPTYTGDFKWGNSDSTDGKHYIVNHHIGFVPKVIYEKVQKVLAKPIRRYTKKCEKPEKFARLHQIFEESMTRAEEWLKRHPFDKFKTPPNNGVLEFFEL
jgi:hypothetical protein